MYSTDLVLGLGFRGLKGAGQDCQLDILQLLWHLWMTHVLVHNNAIHQLCILQLAANFAINLQTDSSLLKEPCSYNPFSEETCSYSPFTHCINLTSWTRMRCPCIMHEHACCNTMQIRLLWPDNAGTRLSAQQSHETIKQFSDDNQGADLDQL